MFFIPALVSLLVTKGLDLLADKLSNVTEEGASKIGTFIEEKTGINVLDEEKVKALTDEDVAKIREATLHYRVELQRLALEFLKAEYQDAQNARTATITDTAGARQMFKDQAGNADYRKSVLLLAWFYSVLGMAYIFLITFIPIPKENVRFADTALGFILASVIGMIIGFFFGNSFKSNGSVNRVDDNRGIAPQGLADQAMSVVVGASEDALISSAKDKLRSMVGK